jgi:hypothetical protein
MHGGLQRDGDWVRHRFGKSFRLRSHRRRYGCSASKVGRLARSRGGRDMPTYSALLTRFTRAVDAWDGLAGLFFCTH